MRPLLVVPASLLALSTLLPAAMAASPDLAALPPELSDTAVPQVLTPARLAQAQVDVAASVTVIDRDMILALGARDVPDLLRLVPGMMVTRTSGHEFAVNYHGTNIRDIRRLQVLVDGMSVYQPGFARILWSELPVSMDDIERIEVTRGPDAASYGANSFSAIINIITVHPQDSTDNMLRVAGFSPAVFDNNRGTADTGGRLVGHGDRSDWRLSFSTRADTGFDEDRWGLPYRDDREVGLVNWRSEFRPDDRDRLELMVAVADSKKEEYAESYDVFTRYEDEPVNSVRYSNLLGRWTRELSPDHVVQLQAYAQQTDSRYRWRSCLDPILLSDELGALAAIDQSYAEGLLAAAANPATLPAYIGSLPPAAQAAAIAVIDAYTDFQVGGFTETCGSVNLDSRESRFDIEVQDTLRVNDQLRVVSGASYRRDSAASESYLHAARHNEVWRLFAHGEYRMVDSLLFNVGAMVERDDVSGTQLSPRAGVNWRVADQQSLRLVSSRAVRNQDIYGKYASTGLTFRELSPAFPAGDTTADFFLAQSTSTLPLPEEINAFEVGYFGYFPALRTDMDVRWFCEKLNKLVSDPANFFEFEVDNDSWTELRGIEFQVHHSLAPGSWAWASYAYIDNDSTNIIETKFTARHSGSVAVAHRFASRWNASAAWYVNRYQNRIAGRYWYHAERLDLRVAHDIPLGGATLQVYANAQCDTDDNPEIFIDNNYDDRVYAYLGMQLTF